MSLGGFFKKVGKGALTGLKVTGRVGKDHLLPLALDALPLRMGRVVNELVDMAWDKAVDEAKDNETGVVDEAKLRELLTARVLDEIHKRQPDRKED